jgi:two-component system, NtrC family, sensor kinase
MKFYRLLSFRLFILIFFVLTTFTIVISYYLIKFESDQFEEVARQCAQRTSEVIANSTRHSMLRNQNEDTYEIIDAIAKQKAITKISLYDKEGEIVFSTNRNEIGQISNMTDYACNSCHEKSGELKSIPSELRHQISVDSLGIRYLSYHTPVLNEKSCYTAECHYHKEDKKFAGLINLKMSLGNLDKAVEQNQSRMISTNVMVILILSLSVGIFIWFFVHVPVNKLILGTKEISSGNLGYKINSKGKDEIGLLGASFNEMSRDLKNAKQEITSWSNQLENRVKDKTEELEKTQKRNIQIEKMASLGQLSATVAHELNNPIAGILTYSKLIQKKLNKDDVGEDEKKKIIKQLKMIESESQRSGDIVKNMLLFSRQEAVEMKGTDIREVIESSIDLIAHHLQLHNIELKKYFQVNLPQIYIDENQIKQALLALFVNAVEAMEDNGTMTIKTDWKKPNDFIQIHISDTGKGISEDVRTQIFEPFFTTKNAVKGVGLGLSAVYAIVHKHNGEIAVESEIDKGTTFIINLPLKQNR